MIELKEVCKQYVTKRIPGKWVLDGVSLSIPAHTTVGVVGAKGSGKSTLLRIMSGVEQPTKGEVVRNARISSPTRYSHSFQPLLTGRQNAKFIFRINGFVDDLEERLALVEAHMSLEGNFDKPVKGYKQQQKLSLSFALSVTLGFDFYLSDGFNFFSQPSLKEKGEADKALKSIAERSGLILVLPPVLKDQLLAQYCTAGIWLHDGRAEWFNDVNDALAANRESTQRHRAKTERNQTDTDVSEGGGLMTKVNSFQNALRILGAGIRGRPEVIPAQTTTQVLNRAKKIGIRLVAVDQLEELGYTTKEGAVPILKSTRGGGTMVEYYDLGTQCEKLNNT